MTKQDIIRAMEDLPEDATVEDAIDRLVYVYEIGRGIRDAEAGRRISRAEAQARMARWRS